MSIEVYIIIKWYEYLSWFSRYAAQWLLSKNGANVEVEYDKRPHIISSYNLNQNDKTKRYQQAAQE